MAAIANIPLPGGDEDQLPGEPLSERFMDWVRTELVWYAGSFSFHLLALSALLLMPTLHEPGDQNDVPVFASNNDELEKKEPEKFDNVPIGDLADSLEKDPPSDLIVDPAMKPVVQEPDDQVAGVHTVNLPGGTPNGIKGLVSPGVALTFGDGPRFLGRSGIGTGKGTSTNEGDGGGGDGYEFRKSKHLPPDATGRSQRAVNAALVWLANHQLSDGSWSLQHYSDRCTDRTCTGVGEISADAGATAMGLLPFLGAGQTHMSKGIYKEHVRRGIQWLIRQQQPDGNLAKGSPQMMYSHGLATIALSEAFGMTGDREAGRAAQAAVNFILAAQNANDGGWRYNPGEPGDTSVVGWQLMALKSAHMAGLNVSGSVFSGASKWLDSVALHDGAEYAYQPGQGPAATMTSVGLLCRQYLGAKRDSRMLSGGMAYLLNHMPDEAFPNIYYWYYATQVMHNMYGSEWDAWNRKIRELLVRTQIRNVDQCANGSWAPEKDAWGRRGGRLMQTSLSTLTLEVYYRYMPLFKADTSR